MKIKAILTGATGMVGEGVLMECLQNENVEAVLVLGRRACGVKHPKVSELVLKDMHDLSGLESQLRGYNACYYCLGTSSVGMNEEDYTRITYTLTMAIAEPLARLNPDMTFCFISGSGTDSSEKGRSMWANVKGKTENALLKLPFRAAYNFRPGFMKATSGQKNLPKAYKWIAWMYPFFRLILSKYVSTLQEVALAMIHASIHGADKKVLEVKDMVKLAKT